MKGTGKDRQSPPDDAQGGGYSQKETLERLAKEGNIDAIKMLHDVQREEALSDLIKEKFGV
ncbi:MAG: hypothetical protein LBF67_08160 [Prevotellaceae bacterium]|jgi:hypothetical protein|nr:hypothetical protein [Prevotellaceae bacterium]